MMWGMVFVKFIIFCAHALRSVAVIKIYNEPTDLSCFEYDTENSQIYQGLGRWKPDFKKAGKICDPVTKIRGIGTVVWTLSTTYF